MVVADVGIGVTEELTIGILRQEGQDARRAAASVGSVNSRALGR